MQKVRWLGACFLCATLFFSSWSMAQVSPGNKPSGSSGSSVKSRSRAATTRLRRNRVEAPPVRMISGGPTLAVGFPRLGTVGGILRFREQFIFHFDYGTTTEQYYFFTNSWGVGGGWFFVPNAFLDLTYGQYALSFQKQSTSSEYIGDATSPTEFTAVRRSRVDGDFVSLTLGYWVQLGRYVAFSADLGWFQPISAALSFQGNENEIPAGFASAESMRADLSEVDDIVTQWGMGGKPYVTLTRITVTF